MTIEQAIEQYENSERMNKELAEKSMFPTVKISLLGVMSGRDAANAVKI